MPTSELTDEQIEVDYNESYNIVNDDDLSEFLNSLKSVIKKKMIYTCELKIGDIYNLRLIELVIIKDLLSKLYNRSNEHKLLIESYLKIIDLNLKDCLVYLIGLL